MEIKKGGTAQLATTWKGGCLQGNDAKEYVYEKNEKVLMNMFNKEKNYLCDFDGAHYKQQTCQTHDHIRQSPITVAFHSSVTHDDLIRDQDRHELVKWMYKVVDHYGFDRETAAIAMSYFDRMLWKVESCQYATEPCHELLAVTTLYLAAKLFEKRGRSVLRDFVLMSRNKFRADQISKMEAELLSMLSWNVHPNTPQVFSIYFLKLLSSRPSSSMSNSYAHIVLEVANFIIELALFDSSLVQEKPSEIACAAILMAMQTCDDPSVSYSDNSSWLIKTLNAEADASRLSLVEKKLRANLEDSSITIEEVYADSVRVLTEDYHNSVHSLIG